MLNDVLSLMVALYAIKVSTNTPTSKYSYGWHRAEILAALVNGVFLLALCLSIFLEAIVRFFSVPEISNPKLVVIVGSLGLASNILGLFLFHEHGASHDHGHKSEAGKGANSSSNPNGPLNETTPAPIPSADSVMSPQHDPSPVFYGHPAQSRANVVHAAEQAGYNRSSSQSRLHSSSSVHSAIAGPQDRSVPEDAVVIGIDGKLPSPTHPLSRPHSHSHNRNYHNQRPSQSEIHEETLAANGYGNTRVGHGHSHGSMNMHALLLHVLGDALGNVGVIASGLIIWLTEWKRRFLSDPIISLVITVIIFTSALPLVKSASFILLQGVPTSVALEDLREDIRRVRGVASLHELHVWQLSEQKIIASVHIRVARDAEYMRIQSDIREVLHEYNIHSCTIQPENEDESTSASPTVNVPHS
ncbi:cation efflux protein [Clavulina sp. PMI_390]|nr:cation efflux protein [Clavulina sp. PMI_390]